jgi:hypothetical protein
MVGSSLEALLDEEIAYVRFKKNRVLKHVYRLEEIEKILEQKKSMPVHERRFSTTAVRVQVPRVQGRQSSAALF